MLDFSANVFEAAKSSINLFKLGPKQFASIRFARFKSFIVIRKKN
jgi:hypothetical protein